MVIDQAIPPQPADNDHGAAAPPPPAAEIDRPPPAAPAPPQQPPVNIDGLPQGPLTTLLQGGPADIWERCKVAGLISPHRTCHGKPCVWRPNGDNKWRWRCNTCKKTIVPGKDSLFAGASLPIRSLLIMIIQWLSNVSISATALLTGASSQAVVRFRWKLKGFCNRYMRRYPHNFNRNAMALVGSQMGRCSEDCIIFLIATNTSSVLLHNRAQRYSQRKPLPLLENTDGIYSDQECSALLLPAGCHHSPILGCPVDKTERVRRAREYILSKRNMKCENADDVCAEFNYRERYGNLPDLQQVFLDHYAELYRFV